MTLHEDNCYHCACFKIFTFLSYHLIFKLFSENEKSSFFWKSPIHSECLTLYIINKNYQWMLTFGLLKYLLPSKLLFFLYKNVPLFFFNSYFIYLYRCYSYIFCFHFKGWPKRRIIHIASSKCKMQKMLWVNQIYSR